VIIFLSTSSRLSEEQRREQIEEIEKIKRIIWFYNNS